MRFALWSTAVLTVLTVLVSTSQAIAQEKASSPSAVSSTASPNASGTAPADPRAAMLAGAGKQKTAENELVAQFKQGGNVMWVLLLLSVMFVTYTVERLVNLRMKKIVPEDLAEKADELWKEGKYAEIEELCEKSDSVLARIIKQIVKRRNEGPERLHTIAGDVGAREMRLQIQKAYPLAIAATLAPLLGLLGTVSGMIDAFNTVALAGSLGNPALLADSISKAMVATGAGLIVAIPSLGAYHYFKGRTLIYTVQLEETITDLLCDWFPHRDSKEVKQ
ncbi:MAG TPA: biopolymer transporter ExbB [Lentisphaeria bacterium]|nr:MAG: hypothetical protein A2X45_14140 [Lentisphaerae bacterium GWF2_50_93]HCE42489.1 biopolymer transporter ExbB [Lentisphaeria bacterium]